MPIRSTFVLPLCQHSRQPVGCRELDGNQEDGAKKAHFG